MSDAPVIQIDPVAFHADPYPVLSRMQAETPVAFVPELGATLFTRRDDIFEQEKRVDVFSSDQPDGLMTRLMGQNMMRKDGKAHQAERRDTFPAFSPRTVRDQWLRQFRLAAQDILERLAPTGAADLVADYALLLSGEALRIITGLSSMSALEMDRASQGMIDGIANYANDPDTEARCRAATALIDDHITRMIPEKKANPDLSLLSVQLQADMPEDSLRANIKLAISGGQNEPRDAIAGTVWALLQNPDQLQQIRDGKATWQQAFEEYARWMAPIGMSPRQVRRADTVNGVTFDIGDRVFFMYGIANRDPAHFHNPDRFDMSNDARKALSFGAGPHFCAGAAASRALICEVALPQLFEQLPGLECSGPVRFEGWAFRGPVSLPVGWDSSC